MRDLSCNIFNFLYNWNFPGVPREMVFLGQAGTCQVSPWSGTHVPWSTEHPSCVSGTQGWHDCYCKYLEIRITACFFREKPKQSKAKTMQLPREVLKGNGSTLCGKGPVSPSLSPPSLGMVKKCEQLVERRHFSPDMEAACELAAGREHLFLVCMC